MKELRTLDQLIDTLNNSDTKDFPKILKKVSIPIDQFTSFATWERNDYTRNCLARSEEYELILMCWDAGCLSPIHDHGGEDCWVYQLCGSVEEVRYVSESGELKETHRMELHPGRLAYMHDKMGYHTIGNRSKQRAMSLHLYSSPIDKCKIFNDNKQCFEAKDMTYDTFVGDQIKNTAA